MTNRGYVCAQEKHLNFIMITVFTTRHFLILQIEKYLRQYTSPSLCKKKSEQVLYYSTCKPSAHTQGEKKNVRRKWIRRQRQILLLKGYLFRWCCRCVVVARYVRVCVSMNEALKSNSFSPFLTEESRLDEKRALHRIEKNINWEESHYQPHWL